MIRPATEADRKKYADLMGDSKALDVPGNHSFVLEDGGKIVGAVVWYERKSGTAILGAVTLAPGRTRKDLYRLVLATAEDGVARGQKRGVFTLKNAALLKVIRQTFKNIDVEAVGRDPKTGKAVEWRVEIDAADQIQQLRAVIGPEAVS